jgi:hypothetical protein
LNVPHFWIDSDVLIRAKDEAYAMEITPGFWRLLELSAKKKTGIRMPMAVYEELRKGHDELSGWAKAWVDDLFSNPDQQVQESAGEIGQFVIDNFARAYSDKFLEGADVWLVAHARAKGGSVVTHEAPAQVGDPRVKIPDVCNEYGINWESPYSMLRKLEARFVLETPSARTKA